MCNVFVKIKLETTSSQSFPSESVPQRVIQVACGTFHTILLLDDGTIIVKHSTKSIIDMIQTTSSIWVHIQMHPYAPICMWW